MSPSLALYTAARRYCLDQFAYWADVYERLGQKRQPDGYHYTAEALDIFPRYNVLRAIRLAIESLDPETLPDLETTRADLIHLGQTAEDPFMLNASGTIEQQAIAQERAEFCQYIASLKPGALRRVAPLPYRRIVPTATAEELRARFRQVWHITEGYWYPLAECSVPGVVAFDAQAYGNLVPPEGVQALLRQRGIERVWELREGGSLTEIDVALFVPLYNGEEGLWSAGELDWIVYASHENSLTLGGWLAEEIQTLYPTLLESPWQA